MGKRGPKPGWKKNKSTSPRAKSEIKASTVPDRNAGTLNLYGMRMEVDENYIQRLVDQQVTGYQKHFENTVLGPFEKFIDELARSVEASGQCPESLNLPAEIGTASATYSITPRSDRVLVPGNDYALRSHAGLMVLMMRFASRIVGLEKQIHDLRCRSKKARTEASNETSSENAPAARSEDAGVPAIHSPFQTPTASVSI